MNTTVLMAVLKSRTFWTIVATFVVNGLQAIDPMLPAAGQIAITAILSLAATYFHVSPSASTVQARLALADKKVTELKK